MKSLASTRYARATMRRDDSLGRGMDAAFTLVAFTGVGYLLDRLFGTQPVFMIVLVVLAAVGLFYSFKARYTAAMEQHEAQRAHSSVPRQVAPDRLTPDHVRVEQ